LRCPLEQKSLENARKTLKITRLRELPVGNDDEAG